MPWRSFILSVLLILSALINVSLFAQQDAPKEQETVYFDGLLISKKKYSFTVSGSDQDYLVNFDPATVVAARVIRPSFDWAKRKVAGQIPASAFDGRAKNNLKIDYELPKKIYFRHRFDSAEQLSSTLAISPIPLNRLVLSKVPLRDAVSAGDKPEWTGELLISQPDSALHAMFADEKLTLKPNWSTLLIEGFNLLDVEPFETDVFVNAVKTDGELVAKRVEFSPRLNLKKIFAQPRPKCLVIGDTVSFNYMAALIKELDGEATIHHPNSNCLGSASFKHLHRWLALNRGIEFKWDVIAFNFGHADHSLGKATYQANLQKCVDILGKSGASLIWIESTPVPYGFNDSNLKPGEFIPEDQQFDFEFEETNPTSMKPGRMKVQNRWAEELLKSHPEIKICKLWDVVKKDEEDKYKTWWYGKAANFRYSQSLPLARHLAKTIRESLKK